VLPFRAPRHRTGSLSKGAGMIPAISEKRMSEDDDLPMTPLASTPSLYHFVSSLRLET